MKKLYIAGKITGLPRWWVVLKFGFWQDIFEFLGYDIYNPVELIDKETSYSDAMDRCYVLVYYCQEIFTMPGWSKSKGAVKERNYALDLNKKIIGFKK